MESKRTAGRFYGETIRRRRIPGVTLSEVRFPGDVEVPPHAHARPIFNFVLAGGYIERWGRRSMELEPAALLFHPEGLVHSERFSSAGARCLTMEVEPSELRLEDAVARLQDNLALTRGRWSWIAARCRREMREADDLSPTVIEGLLHVLVGEAARSTLPTDRRAPRFARTAREILRETFTAPPTIADLAAEVGVHPSHLTRTFRRYFGCTPGEYARRRRFEHACRLLEETDRPLAAVAQAAGYADQSHFTRAFRRRTGSTPGAHRDALD